MPADFQYSTDLNIQHRRATVAALYLKRQTQVDIAQALDVDQSTISRDLKAIHETWRQSALVDTNESKQAELAKIDALEREYWEAWEASKKPRKRTSKRSGNEITMALEERTGDPRYLAGVQWCIQQRCKILGIEAPQRSENRQVDKDGNDVFMYLIGQLRGQNDAAIMLDEYSG